MYEQSWSETAGAGADALPPHIRDMLAATTEVAEPALPEIRSKEKASSSLSVNRGGDEEESEISVLKSSLSQSRVRSEHFKSRCEALTKKIADRELELRELRGYVQDTARLQERDHAYLRATHLDPAVALEIELLKRRLETSAQKPDSDPVKQFSDDLVREHADLNQRYDQLIIENDELSAAAAAYQAERDHLRLTVRQLREELTGLQQWNEQLEEEREHFFVQAQQNFTSSEENQLNQGSQQLPSAPPDTMDLAYNSTAYHQQLPPQPNGGPYGPGDYSALPNQHQQQQQQQQAAWGHQQHPPPAGYY